MRNAIVVGLALCAGCYGEIRSSSRDLLTREDSQLVLPVPIEYSEQLVSDTFAKRGFHIVDKRDVQGGATLCTYKGSRTVATGVVAGYGASNSIGSVFYVYFSKDNDKTRVTFFGKPTIDGQIPCADPDAEFRLRCDRVEKDYLWWGRHLTSGAEESETIRGIQIELARTPIGAERPVSVLTPVRGEDAYVLNCHLEGTPAWSNAGAYEKKRMLEECWAKERARTPTSTQ